MLVHRHDYLITKTDDEINTVLQNENYTLISSEIKEEKGVVVENYINNCSKLSLVFDVYLNNLRDYKRGQILGIKEIE